jgi:hypothetical protein
MSGLNPLQFETTHANLTYLPMSEPEHTFLQLKIDYWHWNPTPIVSHIAASSLSLVVSTIVAGSNVNSVLRVSHWEDHAAPKLSQLHTGTCSIFVKNVKHQAD